MKAFCATSTNVHNKIKEHFKDLGIHIKDANKLDENSKEQNEKKDTMIANMGVNMANLTRETARFKREITLLEEKQTNTQMKLASGARQSTR